MSDQGKVKKAFRFDGDQNLASLFDQLLSNACASIQSRLRLEVLGQRWDDPAVSDLQKLIRHDPALRPWLLSQAADGWLGEGFHGYGGIEAGLRLLCEKGLVQEDPAMVSALEILRKSKGRLYEGIGHVGRILDEGGYGGSETIRACLLAGRT